MHFFVLWIRDRFWSSVLAADRLGTIGCAFNWYSEFLFVTSNLWFQKCEGTLPPEWRKFSVDPQITSLEVLYSILAKAFDLKTDFAISYKTLDPSGQEVYLAVLSDWDLDAAFLRFHFRSYSILIKCTKLLFIHRAHNLSISTSTEPCLNLKVDIKPFSESTIDWDASSNSSSQREISPLQQSIGVGQKYVQNMQTRLPGLIMNQVSVRISSSRIGQR